MNKKELLEKLYNDKNFRSFCEMVDQKRAKSEVINILLETTTLLFDYQIDCIKGDENLSFIHELVREFLNPRGRKASNKTIFFDYFVINSLIWIAENNRAKIEQNQFRLLPLDITEYVKSLCNIGVCTCGYEPKVFLRSFINSPSINIICEKCGLKTCTLLTHEADFFKGDSGVVYVNLEDGIKRAYQSWNNLIEKNESILHRTMRELLQYNANCCVNELKMKMHDKLYGYMVDNKIYRKPKYWNEEGYWDIATDKMLECEEPKKWVEDYLWENLPSKISA